MKTEYTKNFWAKILCPYIIIMWTILLYGIILILVFQDMKGWIVLGLSCVVFAGWWEIQIRSAKYKEKKKNEN